MIINENNALPLMTIEQKLTEEEQAQARKNLGKFTTDSLATDCISMEFTQIERDGKMQNINLEISSWEASADRTHFKQTITIPGIPVENCKYIFSFNGKDRTGTDQLLLRNLWGNIFYVDNNGEEFTFYSEDKLEYTLPIKVLVVKK